MQYQLKRHTFCTLLEMAQLCMPNEVVGWVRGVPLLDYPEPTILWDDVGAFENLHPDPQSGFELDPSAVLSTYQQIVQTDGCHFGLWHSHPMHAPQPGMTDLDCMRRLPPHAFLIIGLAQRQIAQWELVGPDALPVMRCTFAVPYEAVQMPTSTRAWLWKQWLYQRLWG